MIRTAATLILLFILSSCGGFFNENHDPYLQLKREQIKESLQPEKTIRPLEIAHPPQNIIKNNTPKIPAKMMQKISVHMTENIPVIDVIREVAMQVNVDVALPSKLKKSIIFSAQNRPFIEVIDKICKLANLRYFVEDTTLFIEEDLPFLVNYNVQFLNHSRNSESRIAVATDVFSSGDGQHSNNDNGSHNTVSGSSKNDFWQELESNLKSILDQSNDSQKSSYTMHKQGGILSVHATQHQHALLESFLNDLQNSISSQVLIEAKIIEVALHDEFRSGIDWFRVRGSVNAAAAFGDTIQPGKPDFNKLASPDMFSFAINTDSLSSVIGLVEKFGTTRVLSSPRLTVINNQPAVLKVAENQVYFRLKYDRQIAIDGKRDIINTSSEVQTVPIGLIMTVQPAINNKNGEITMNLRPTITSTTESKADPAVDIASDGKTRSFIPVVQVREIDSVVHLKSGQVIVMGGLMQERSRNNRSGLPGSSEVPFFGHFFSGKSNSNDVVELIIILKATIEKAPALTTSDRRVYNVFTKDPRPI